MQCHRFIFEFLTKVELVTSYTIYVIYYIFRVIYQHLIFIVYDVVVRSIRLDGIIGHQLLDSNNYSTWYLGCRFQIICLIDQPSFVLYHQYQLWLKFYFHAFLDNYWPVSSEVEQRKMNYYWRCDKEVELIAISWNIPFN